MNKKFLSVVLFGALMAGSSVTFTGCIDNDEPAGIENLRGAKAELLKAKAAVETANAAYRDAETQLKLAEVEKEISGMIGNVDGGNASSCYGGCITVDGGNAETEM